MGKEKQQFSNNESSIHDLLHKHMADQLNIEESKELTNRSIVAALETMETVKKQREEIELKENKAAMLDLAVTIYQGFISSIGMNEEFADFYNESISKMIEEEQETVQ